MALMKRRKDSTGEAAGALTLERSRRDLDAADAERADAVQAMHDLDARRADVLASEDVAQLEAHEDATAAAQRRVAVAERRCQRLAGEVEASEVQAEQARRLTAYRAAEKGLIEARRAIAQEYPAAARAVRDILNRARELQAAAEAANDALPEGADRLDTILEPDGFNGLHYAAFPGLTETRAVFVNRATGEPPTPFDMPEHPANAHLWRREERDVTHPVPTIPAGPHRSVLDFVNLPGFTDETYIYSAPHWGRPRCRAIVVERSPYLGKS